MPIGTNGHAIGQAVKGVSVTVVEVELIRLRSTKEACDNVEVTVTVHISNGDGCGLVRVRAYIGALRAVLDALADRVVSTEISDLADGSEATLSQVLDGNAGGDRGNAGNGGGPP